MSELPILETQMHDLREDWKNILRQSVRSKAELEKVLELEECEKAALNYLKVSGGLPFTISERMLKLIDPQDPQDPIRLQLIPRMDEFPSNDAAEKSDPYLMRDPLGEEGLEVVPNLVHRYPDRVLLLATDRCAAYCRFCTRKRFVGQGPSASWQHLIEAFSYIQEHPEIHEVIVSGGDALIFDNEKLDRLLQMIREIKHIEIIRLASRMISFVPQRINSKLIEVLQKHHPVYILAHFNHPRELLGESEKAILKLSNAGIPVLNQSVLLKGINDDPVILAQLFRHLTRLRARPYYLHQCDLTMGSQHFRVPLKRALEIMKSLRGHISGLSVPTLIIDIPGGHGKVPMQPNPIVSENDDGIILEGFEGKHGFYPWH